MQSLLEKAGELACLLQDKPVHTFFSAKDTRRPKTYWSPATPTPASTHTTEKFPRSTAKQKQPGLAQRQRRKCGGTGAGFGCVFVSWGFVAYFAGR